MSIKLEMQVSVKDIEKALNEVKNDKPSTNNKVQKNKLTTNDNIQEQICNNIKSKVAKSSSMKLENEEILEDNSVLLTISV